MISKSIIEEYKKVFILCLEVAGEKTGDKFLLNVERNLDSELVNSIIDELEGRKKEVTMGDVICIMLSTLLVPKVLGMNHKTCEDIEIDSDYMSSLPGKIKQVSEEAANLYRNYLKTASDKFCKDRGIDLKIDFNSTAKSNLMF